MLHITFGDADTYWQGYPSHHAVDATALQRACRRFCGRVRRVRHIVSTLPYAPLYALLVALLAGLCFGVGYRGVVQHLKDERNRQMWESEWADDLGWC